MQALEILTRELGPKDPRTACAEYNLGTVLSGAGDDEAAQARARASVQRLGPQPRSRPAHWHAWCRPPVRSLAAWPHSCSDTAQRRVRPRGWLRAGMRWLMLTGVCRRQSCHLKEGPQQGGSSSKRDAGAVAGVRGCRADHVPPGVARPAPTPTTRARRRQVHFQKCLDARRAVLGPGHPGTVDAVQALAACASSREASLEILNAHVAALEAAGQANSAGARRAGAGGEGRSRPWV